MDPETWARNGLAHMLLDDSAEPIDLPLSLLTAITNNFSEDRKIGSGGFADVYKGILQNGAVAVKRISDSVNLDETRFIKEVDCLMRVKHKNIVRFLGYCTDTLGQIAITEGKYVMAEVRRRLLCFEYVPRGSLDNYITDVSLGLEWKMRYQIIKGICEGLHHVHDKRIVHLGLKPGNILLNHNMVPKIGDFVDSWIFDGDETQNMEEQRFESLGYWAPETLTAGVITFKSDIYALGIIMAEILTGEKQYSSVVNVLEGWRNRLEKSGEDTQLEQIRVCAEICIRCQDLDPMKRPAIQGIIEELDETERMMPDTHTTYNRGA